MKSKTDKITMFLTMNPDAKPAAVAAKFKVSAPYIYTLRKKLNNDMSALLGLGQGAVIKEEGAPVYPDLEPSSVDKVLDTRATQYGTFADGAALMQSLKRTLSAHAQKHGKTFADDQWEALEMIVHKMARIVNGNPDNVDSWTDIAGYAKLVADRLEGNAR